MLAAVSIARATAKRATMLIEHNQLALCQKLHIVALWQARSKLKCLACAREGYASATASFLRQVCTLNGLDQALSMHDLLNQLAFERCLPQLSQGIDP